MSSEEKGDDRRGRLDRIDRIEKLKGTDNYLLWKFGISIMFRSAGVYGVVTGTTPKPEKLEDIAAWNKKDGQAQELIISSIHKDVMVHILMCGTAKSMWDKLKKLYQKLDQEQKCKLQLEFLNLKFEKGETMSVFLSRIQNLFFRLKAFDDKIDEDLLVNKIIISLPQKYDNFITAWKLDKNRKLDDLVENLISEEASKKPTEESVAFMSTKQDKKFKNWKGNSGPRCFKCNQVGHKKSECKNKQAEFNKKYTCSICKNPKSKHTEDMCYFRNKEKTKNEKHDKQVSFIAENNTNNNTDYEEWVCDSGSTSHMTNNYRFLKCVKNETSEIVIAKGGTSLITTKSGTVETDQCVLTNVLYSNELSKNLFSVNAAVNAGAEVRFTEEGVSIIKDGEIILSGIKRANGLFTLNLKGKEPHAAFVVHETDEILKWHKKLGHLSGENIKKLSHISDGLEIKKDKDLSKVLKECDVCTKTKQTRLSFGKEREKAKRPLQIVHSDLSGCIEPETWDHKHYYATFKDDFTGFTQTYLLSHKSELFEALKEYTAEVENKWTLPISTLRCDNGGEYTSKEIKTWCKQKGILLDYCPAYTPQLNGSAERENRTLIEKARPMLKTSGLNKKFWGEAIYVATYLANRSPHRGHEKTPYENWYGKTPQLKNLQIFGCKAFAKKLTHLKKLEDRSEEFIFVGYTNTGYRLWDESKQKIVISRDVIFKDCKPVVTKNESEEEEFLERASIDGDEDLSDQEGDKRDQHEIEDTGIEDVEDQLFNTSGSTQGEMTSDSEWQPFLTSDTDDNEANETVIELDEDGRRYPDRDRAQPDRYNPSAMMTMHGEPTTVKEALSPNNMYKDKWLHAMRSEIDSFNKKGTWELTELPRGRKVVDCKWVFKIKRGTDNNIEKFKARLVARGFTQTYGIDYTETFSPVVRYSTIRLLIAIAVKMDLKIEHLDVPTAFLNGDLEEEIFLKQPEGFIKKGQENKVYLLKKAVYGLKQASRNWNQEVEKTLVTFGLKKSKLENCVYFSISGNSIMIVALFVDDFFLFNNDPTKSKKLKLILEERYDIKDLGEANFLLGMKLARDKETGEIKLTQKEYAIDVLKRYNMSDCKPVSTPLEMKSSKKSEAEERDTIEGTPYQNLIGSLMYLAICTRPDLSYTLSYLSQFNKHPTKRNWQDAKRVLRYLKGTIEYGVTFKKDELKMYGYIDSDWGGNELDRKSFTGYIFKFGNAPVSWEAKKQKTVALSSCEAEYMGLAEGCKEALFIYNLFEEIFSQKLKIELLNDSQSAHKIVKNPIQHKRTKHIDIKYHFIRDVIRSEKFELTYIPTEDMLADVMTKTLGSQKHKKCVEGILQ